MRIWYCHYKDWSIWIKKGSQHTLRAPFVVTKNVCPMGNQLLLVSMRHTFSLSYVGVTLELKKSDLSQHISVYLARQSVGKVVEMVVPKTASSGIDCSMCDE